MLRRYLLPCALVMAVSVGTAGVAYKTARNRNFAASCSFQAFLSISQDPPISAEAQTAYNKLAATEVNVARVTDVFPAAAAKLKVSPGSLPAHVVVGPFGGDVGTFIVNTSDTDPKMAVAIANTVCDAFVTSIQKRRAAESNTLVKTIENRIANIDAQIRNIEGIAKNRRTTADIARLVGQLAAHRANVQVLANILSYLPDKITVLTRAAGVTSLDKRSLPKNLVISLVAGILVCFLIVLIGETLAESRRSRSSAPV